jgi:hypothetical protein
VTIEHKDSELYQEAKDRFWQMINGDISFDLWLGFMQDWELKMDQTFPGWGGWTFAELRS